MAGSHPRLIAAGALGVAAVAVGAVALSAGGGGDDDPSAASRSTATAQIRRQDLVETETVDGTLGYSDARSVVNRLAGTVTWTPGVGSVVHLDERLYEVDEHAVYLLDGSFPAYRALKPGLRGDDVRRLERNLRRLGLDSNRAMTVDGTWDAGTTAAVQRWQARKGMQQSGTIERGRIVFAPGARRVSKIELSAGSSASGSGGGGGDEVAGTIARVGTVAQRKATGQDEDPPATITLSVKLRRSASTRLDQAPVDVRLEKQRAKDVLTVPVTALLARSGGTSPSSCATARSGASSPSRQASTPTATSRCAAPGCGRGCWSPTRRSDVALIELRDVVKAYPGGVRALNG